MWMNFLKQMVKIRGMYFVALPLPVHTRTQEDVAM